MRATFGDTKANPRDWQQESLNVREQKIKALCIDSAASLEEELFDDSADGYDKAPKLMMLIEERTTGTDSLPPHRLYNPHKQKLAELCRIQPGNANSVLRRELSHRSQLDTVLSSIGKNIQKQGSGQRLGRRDSRRITRALNRVMLSGASRQVSR